MGLASNGGAGKNGQACSNTGRLGLKQRKAKGALKRESNEGKVGS